MTDYTYPSIFFSYFLFSCWRWSGLLLLPLAQGRIHGTNSEEQSTACSRTIQTKPNRIHRRPRARRP